MEGRQVAAPILSTFKLHQQVFPLFLKKKKISCIYKASNHNSSGDKTSCRIETSEQDEEKKEGKAEHKETTNRTKHKLQESKDKILVNPTPYAPYDDTTTYLSHSYKCDKDH